MTTSSHALQRGSYELVDNVDYGSHQQALAWLAENYAGPLNVATGYIGLEGLDALAKIADGTGPAHSPVDWRRAGDAGWSTRRDRC